MSDLHAYHAIEAAERRVRSLKDDYLRQHGWDRTCTTPGSYWMWRRSFSDVNERRLEQHRAFCARIGQERNHHAYPAEMLADTDTAIRMTWTEIDPRRLDIEEDE